MGTSKSYSPPTTPQWKNLKNKVTRLANKGKPSISKAKGVIQDFVAVRKASTGSGGGEGGSSGMRVAQNIGQRLGNFVAVVGQVGLEEAVRRIGLSNLEGKSANEVCLALIDYIGGDANSIDEVDARNALANVLDEMFEQAETYDDVEELLCGLTTKEELEVFLQRFFSNYLFEQFNRTFYERLVERVGSAQADSFMNGIQEYISSSVGSRSHDKDLSSIDWSGAEGDRISKIILNETFDIYAGVV